MTYSVYQHWDPLKVCIVGRSYPPEFYSWITVPHVRKLFEKIAIETEEDYQAIIKKLESFGVEILRPEIASINFINNTYIPPPMNPRDVTAMIGTKFYNNYSAFTSSCDSIMSFEYFYFNARESHWPTYCTSEEDINNLPNDIKKLCKLKFENYKLLHKSQDSYDRILMHIKNQGNTIRSFYPELIGAQIARIGKDIYVGTMSHYDPDITKLKNTIDDELVDTRNHIVNTGGHSDGTYCPVCPGLIVSLNDIPTYKETFPGWEVVYLPGQSWAKIDPFLKLKNKNRGKWWIPGFEEDVDVVNIVETWLGHWTGYVEETVFDVNMLVVDPKNVLVFNYNKQVFDALNRYGVTPHIVPFRHRYFWDGGIHCVTSDLHREGVMQDYFPERSV